jgi:hypothetical protein
MVMQKPAVGMHSLKGGSKLQVISTAGDDEWEDLETGTEQIWGDFTTMLGNAVKKIK